MHDETRRRPIANALRWRIRPPAGSMLRHHPARIAALAAIVATGCDGAGVTGPPPVELQAIEIAGGLTQPVHLTAAPNDDRLFVAERTGRIRVIEDGVLLETSFLDLSADVEWGVNEQGLLSVAFHPDYESNGQFYVNYTGEGGATRVERYNVSADPNVADPASAQLVLTEPQPGPKHNSGLLTFGPDGMLYIGMGDGDSAGDPFDNGQDPGTLHGTLLRIDVDGGEPYAVPPDNPYVDEPDWRPEIWAIGLRNPWRFSFDPESKMLFVADVGQNDIEEINAQPASEPGLNYGWNIMEGSDCYRSSDCDTTDLVLPVLEFDHDAGCSAVIGGFVYRGEALRELRGHYFYGNYCSGAVHTFRLTDDGEVTDEREWPLDPLGSTTSIGQDAAGEVYVVVQEGIVYRLAPS
ncbi:MAG: glucose dehydrogenase [Gemmatimonas sp.]|nr:glucose dehydrogenase [Gemmatimonas sp.]